MYTEATLMFMYCETPLHVGSGTSLGIVDLPIQRERYTNYPTAAGSGIKGALREWFETAHLWQAFVDKSGLTGEQLRKILAELGKSEDKRNLSSFDQEKVNAVKEELEKIITVFGPEKDGSEHAGAVSFTDARLLLFPVRSTRGVFAWVTCPKVLGRLVRDLSIAGKQLQVDEVGANGKSIVENGVPKKKSVSWSEPSEDSYFGTTKSAVELERTENGQRAKYTVLEEYVLKREDGANVDDLARWLAEFAFPQGHEYDHWRSRLKTNLLLIHDDNFTEFVGHSTEVNARVKIGEGKSTDTAKGGNLFYEENLPMESLLYSVALASKPHKDNPPSGVQNASHILGFARNLDEKRVQIGGDETIGRGVIKVRFL